MDGFRVSVDLQDFFSDERARCWLWVRGRDRARRLHWLSAQVRRRWALQGPAAFILQSRLLHPRDPVALLQPQDALRVIPLTKNWFEQKSDQSHSTDEEYDVGPAEVLPRGHSSVGTEKSFPTAPLLLTDQADALQREKRRALQLLQAWEEGERQGAGDEVRAEGDGGQVESGAGPQRHRRRRVRRRRRSAPRTCSPPRASSPTPSALPPSVLLNTPSPAPRQPRLIRALESPLSLAQPSGVVSA